MAKGYTPGPPKIYVLNGEIRQAGTMVVVATYVYENGYYNVSILSTGRGMAFKSLGAMRSYFVKFTSQ